MGKCKFDILSLKVDDWIQTLLAHVFIEKVNETILGEKLRPVEIDYQPGIQVYVVFQH